MSTVGKTRAQQEPTSPESQLAAAAAETGWNDESKVVILLRYIKDAGNPDTFAAFLAERVEEEKNLIRFSEMPESVIVEAKVKQE